MKIAAFIPARKGSKRLPGKNKISIDKDFIINKVLRNLSKTSFSIDLFVSTDDPDLKELINVEQVGFLDRSSKFSDDFSTVVDLTKWHYENQLKEYDLVLQSFCHAICVDNKTYDLALRKIIDSKKSSLLSIARLDGPVEWTFKIKGENIKPNFPAQRNERSQDLGVSYIDAGQFYIYKKEWFNQEGYDEYDKHYDWIELSHFQSNDLDEASDLDKLLINYKVSKEAFKELE